MIRVGQGIDFHVFSPQRKLVLGGIEIDYPLGLLGHSDADVLLHTLCDGILGALGLGDIGQHFSDKDPAFKDVDSGLLLKEVLSWVDREGYRLQNIDLTLIGEEPKLSPYREEIRKNLAKLCELDLGMINLKATTTEAMGPLGRKEGLGASCVVLLIKKGGSLDEPL